MYLIIIPNPNCSLGPLTRIVKKDVQIRNPHSKPVAFKVKTTAPKLYCVRPNSEIIQPNSTMTVQSKIYIYIKKIFY
jgi:hypothetical protein